MKLHLRKTIVVVCSVLIIGGLLTYGDTVLNLFLTPLPQGLKSCLSQKFSQDVNAQAVCTSIANGNSVAVWEESGGTATGKIRESKLYEDYTNGYLGIGTSTPANALHLNGNGSSYGIVFTNAANTTGNKGYRIAYDNDRLTFQGADDSGAFESNQVAINKASGNMVIGGTTAIGDSRLSITSSNGDNDAQFAMKKSSANGPVFSILPWDTVTHISTGVYYSNGGWVHDSANSTNDELLRIVPGTGVDWFASSNSTQGGAPTWNSANGVVLWDAAGNWRSPIKYGNVTIDPDGGANYVQQTSSSTTTGTHYYINNSTPAGYVYGDTTGFGLLNNAGNWAYQIPTGTQNGNVYGNLNINGVISCVGGLSGTACPANNVMRLTPNLHLNSYAGYAVIANWDNGTTGSSQAFRVGNGAGTGNAFYVQADGTTYVAGNLGVRTNSFARNMEVAGTQRIRVGGVDQGTGNSAQLEINNAGSGAANISFHREGSWGAHFGLDTDNWLSTRGWSPGASSYSSLKAGNIKANGYLQSVAGGNYNLGSLYFGSQSMHSNSNGWLYVGNAAGTIYAGTGIAMDRTWANSILFTPVIQTNGSDNHLWIRDSGGTDRFAFRYDGQAFGMTWNTGWKDLAENMQPGQGENLEAGDLVMTDPTARNHVVATKGVYEPSTVGVIATKPGLLMNNGVPDAKNGGKVAYRGKPVSLSGRTPTKVSIENGEIKIGDALTSSSVPGVAMKATETGRIVGYAMENFPYTEKQGDPEKDALDQINYHTDFTVESNGKQFQAGKISVFINAGYFVKKNTEKSLVDAVIEKIKTTVIETKQLIVDGLDVAKELRTLKKENADQQSKIDALEKRLEQLEQRH